MEQDSGPIDASSPSLEAFAQGIRGSAITAVLTIVGSALFLSIVDGYCDYKNTGEVRGLRQGRRIKSVASVKVHWILRFLQFLGFLAKQRELFQSNHDLTGPFCSLLIGVTWAWLESKTAASALYHWRRRTDGQDGSEVQKFVDRSCIMTCLTIELSTAALGFFLVQEYLLHKLWTGIIGIVIIPAILGVTLVRRRTTITCSSDGDLQYLPHNYMRGATHLLNCFTIIGGFLLVSHTWYINGIYAVSYFALGIFLNYVPSGRIDSELGAFVGLWLMIIFVVPGGGGLMQDITGIFQDHIRK